MIYLILTAFTICLLGVIWNIGYTVYKEIRAWKKSQAKRKD